MGNFADNFKRPNSEIVELKKRLDKVEENKNKKNKEQETTIYQQYLILEYLGFIERIKEMPNKNGKAKVLSVLLNRGEESFRTKLSEMNLKAKTEQNLLFVKQLFEEIKCSEIVEKIDKDLKRITKK